MEFYVSLRGKSRIWSGIDGGSGELKSLENGAPLDIGILTYNISQILKSTERACVPCTPLELHLGSIHVNWSRCDMR